MIGVSTVAFCWWEGKAEPAGFAVRVHSVLPVDDPGERILFFSSPLSP